MQSAPAIMCSSSMQATNWAAQYTVLYLVEPCSLATACCSLAATSVPEAWYTARLSLAIDPEQHAPSRALSLSLWITSIARRAHHPAGAPLYEYNLQLWRGGPILDVRPSVTIWLDYHLVGTRVGAAHSLGRHPLFGLRAPGCGAAVCVCAGPPSASAVARSGSAGHLRG